MTDTVAPELPAEAVEAIKDEAAEAKQKFSLRDRLGSIKYAMRTVVVFTDEQAVTRFNAVDTQIKSVEGLLGVQVPDDASDEEKAELLEQQAGLRAAYDELEPALEAAREEMVNSALSIHMRAVPQVVLKMATHAADKAYRLGDGTLPEEKAEAWDEKRNRYILGRVIQSIGTPSGSLEFEPDEVAQLLEESLSPTQWSRVSSTYTELMFRDAIGTAATDDPGF
jgi:hypothetical protein